MPVLEGRLDLDAMRVTRDSLHGLHLHANEIKLTGLRATSLDDLQGHVLTRNPVFGTINVAERTGTKPPNDSEAAYQGRSNENSTGIPASRHLWRPVNGHH
jgi:hypothetical protein